MFGQTILSRRLLTAACMLGFLCVGFSTVLGEENAAYSVPDPRLIVEDYAKALLPYQKMKASWISKTAELVDGKLVEKDDDAQRNSVSLDVDRAKLVVQKLDSKRNADGYVERTFKLDGESISAYGLKNVTAERKTSVQSGQNSLYTLTGPSFGFTYPNFIPDLLRAGELKASGETVDGVFLYALESESPKANFKIWINPALNDAAVKMNWRIKDEDPEEESIYEYEVKKWKEYGEVFVPVEFVLTTTSKERHFVRRTEKDETGKETKIVTKRKGEQGEPFTIPAMKSCFAVRLENIEFNPKFTDDDFKIQQKIANGTVVRMLDDPKNRYEWRDGKPTASATGQPQSQDAGKPKEPVGDMQKYLSDTEELARKGRHKEALERFIWFHEHVLEHEPAMAGVRLSFALSSWKKLGDAYPPAKQAFLDMRDKRAEQLRNGQGDYSTFQEVSAFNRELGRRDETVKLFLELEKKDPARAEQCWIMAKDAVFAEKQLDIAKRYIKSPLREYKILKASYDRENAYFEGTKSGGDRFKNWQDKHFVEETLRLITVAKYIGDKKTAEEIRKLAVSVVDDPRLQEPIPTE